MKKPKFRITEEEKARWGPFLRDTFQAIAPDVVPYLEENYGKGQRNRAAGIIEMTLDADRPQMFSGMTEAENRVLPHCGNDNDSVTMRWLRETLNY